jgi:hypothetical protein
MIKCAIKTKERGERLCKKQQNAERMTEKIEYSMMKEEKKISQKSISIGDILVLARVHDFLVDDSANMTDKDKHEHADNADGHS